MKKTILLAVTAALLIASCAQSPADKFARAEENFATHDYAAARLDLISALQTEPANLAMLGLLAKSQLALGDGEGTAATLARMGDAARTPDYRLVLAEAEVMRGRYEDALAVLDGLEDANSWRVRALAQIGLEKPSDAEKAFLAGMDAAGTKAALQAAYARFELARGNRSRARGLVDLALKEQPGLRDGLLVSALVAAQENRLPAALAAYDKAIADYPGNQDALLGKVAILGDMGRLDAAQKLLDTVSDDSSGDLKVVYLRARLASERKDWDGTRRILQQHEQAIRGNPSMQILYAQALLRLGLVEQARGRLVPLVQRYQSQRLARRLLGEAQLSGGDARAALATLKPIAERPDASPDELSLASKAARASGDNSADRYAARAKLPAPEWIGGELAKADGAMRNGNWAAAAESYQNIAERSASPSALVLNNLAFTKSRLGQKDEALALALKALKIAPDNPSVMDTAGWLLVETGEDRDRGRQLLAAAARKSPDNAAIARHLAMAEAR